LVGSAVRVTESSLAGSAHSKNKKGGGRKRNGHQRHIRRTRNSLRFQRKKLTKRGGKPKQTKHHKKGIGLASQQKTQKKNKKKQKHKHQHQVGCEKNDVPHISSWFDRGALPDDRRKRGKE